MQFTENPQLRLKGNLNEHNKYIVKIQVEIKWQDSNNLL